MEHQKCMKRLNILNILSSPERWRERTKRFRILDCFILQIKAGILWAGDNFPTLLPVGYAKINKAYSGKPD